MFNENWYSDKQCGVVGELAKNVMVDGYYIEIGTWEGRSAIAIARAINDGRFLFCVDTWQGNTEESAVTGSEHPSVTIAKGRDVFTTFLDNVRDAGIGNILSFKLSWQKYLQTYYKYILENGIAFLHIDASHDYDSVADCINAFLPFVNVGGVMCGDDYLTASDNRSDLNGGVMRAVKELLPEHTHQDNLWIYQC